MIDIELQWLGSISNSDHSTDEVPLLTVHHRRAKLQYRVIADGHSSEWRDIPYVEQTGKPPS